jgi:hypothetical protein
MKAEDLMNGDWVKIIHHHTPKPLIKVKKVDLEDFRDALLQVYPEITYEPIPLTPKILEKNSFLKVEGIVYPSSRVGISFLYRDTPEGLRIFVQNACVGGPTCTMIKTCKYVHEVQHMIKMCDIEKTFVL